MLTLRQLNRATLARQGLLAREAIGAAEAVDRFGGLQAQDPKPPFVGALEPGGGLPRRTCSRRCTPARSCAAPRCAGRCTSSARTTTSAFRAALQPVLTRGHARARRPRRGAGLDAVLPVARELLEERPRGFKELRAELPGASRRSTSARSASRCGCSCRW